MNKRKTIIFGGAFNPPTIAHQDILTECIKYANKNDADVWIMPSNSRSDKQILVDNDQRVEYIEAMINDIGAPTDIIEIIRHEIDKIGLIKTVDTVKELEILHPNREFEWVFGSDSTQTMGDWEDGQWLLDNLKTLVVLRPGSDINPRVKYCKEICVQEKDVSSTLLRQRIKNGESFDDLVGDAVFRLLNKKYLTVYR